MKKLLLFAALFAVAAAAAGTAAAAGKKKGLTFDGLVKKAIKAGKSKLPAETASAMLGLDNKDYETRRLEAGEESSVDGRARALMVVYEYVERGQPPIPSHLAWLAEDRKAGESAGYLTDLDGKLEKATVKTKDGSPAVDAQSEQAKAGFKKELDFWMRGVGRGRPKSTDTLPLPSVAPAASVSNTQGR